MEELQERRNVGEIEELEGGQPSRNSGQSGPEPREHRIDIVEISPRVKNWIEAFKNAEERTQCISNSMAKDTEGSSHSEGDPGYQEILRTEGIHSVLTTMASPTFAQGK